MQVRAVGDHDRLAAAQCLLHSTRTELRSLRHAVVPVSRLVAQVAVKRPVRHARRLGVRVVNPHFVKDTDPGTEAQRLVGGSGLPGAFSLGAVTVGFQREHFAIPARGHVIPRADLRHHLGLHPRLPAIEVHEERELAAFRRGVHAQQVLVPLDQNLLPAWRQFRELHPAVEPQPRRQSQVHAVGSGSCDTAQLQCRATLALRELRRSDVRVVAAAGRIAKITVKGPIGDGRRLCRGRLAGKALLGAAREGECKDDSVKRTRGHWRGSFGNADLR